MAKGMILSIGFFILSMLLLGLAIIVFSATQYSETRASEAALLTRSQDLDYSLQKTIKDSFNQQSGITFNVQDSTVNILEGFPNGNDTSLNSSLINLQSFLQTDDHRTTINLTRAHIFTVYPYAFNYTNTFNSSIINLSAYTQDVLSYTFEFNVGNRPLGTTTFTDFDAGSFPLNIIMRNATERSNITRNVIITNPVEIDITGVTNGRIEIDINNGTTGIANRLDATIFSNITLTFANTTEVTKILLPEIIFISFPEYNFSRVGSVVLTTS